MVDDPRRLGPPKYRGPGRPVREIAPKDMPWVREGRYCGNCKSFTCDEATRLHLLKSGFWEKVFHGHDDGHDFKPWMVGDVKEYGICGLKDSAAHFFSYCGQWAHRRGFLRMFLKDKG